MLRVFKLYRENPPGNYIKDGFSVPEGPQLEGVVFSDGRVAVRWLTPTGSTSVWDSFEDFEKIHGHPEYGSVWRWMCISDNVMVKP